MGACREPEVELRTDLGDEARARVGPHEHVGGLEVVRVRVKVGDRVVSDPNPYTRLEVVVNDG